MSKPTPRCEHCGDPAAFTKAGKVATFRREPVCKVCAERMGKDDHKCFLDFLRAGGRVHEPGRYKKRAKRSVGEGVSK